jgi:hypothetical protein
MNTINENTVKIKAVSAIEASLVTEQEMAITVIITNNFAENINILIAIIL